MDVDDHIGEIARQADQLASAAGRVGLDAASPPCPGWLVRDVVGHLGGVHRWATSFVRDARTTVDPAEPLAAPPSDGELLDWFRAGYQDLVAVLRRTDDALDCWTFLPAPSARAFWARRQAHETAVHRVDVESADGAVPELGTAFAVDGIDELLLGFFARSRGGLVADPPLTLGVDATDAGTDAAWTITIGPTSREVSRGAARGDCVVSGAASDLYFFLWNRSGRGRLAIDGDDGVLELWRETARITWG